MAGAVPDDIIASVTILETIAFCILYSIDAQFQPLAAIEQDEGHHKGLAAVCLMLKSAPREDERGKIGRASTVKADGPRNEMGILTRQGAAYDDHQGWHGEE